MSPRLLTKFSTRTATKAALMMAAAFLAACEAGLEEEVVLVDPVVEEPVFSAESPAEAAAVRSSAPRSRAPRRGVLTAGDIDDGINLAAFARYQRKTGRALKLPGTNLNKPALAQIVTLDGRVAPGVRVTLRKPGAQEPFYDGYSGVDGMVTVFPAAYGHGAHDRLELGMFPESGQPTKVMLRTGNRTQVTTNANSGWQPDFLDLAFVVDTTGSMADELAWLTQELKL